MFIKQRQPGWENTNELAPRPAKHTLCGAGPKRQSARK